MVQSLWNTVWQFLKKLKHRVTLWLCNSIPGHLLNRNENLCLHKHLPILLYLIKSCNGFPFSVWYGLSFSSHEIKPSTVQLLPLQASFLLSFVSHFALITEHPAVLCKHLRAFAYVVSLTWNDLNFPFDWLTLLLLKGSALCLQKKNLPLLLAELVVPPL